MHSHAAERTLDGRSRFFNAFLTSYRPVTADVWAQRSDRLARRGERRSARGVGEGAMRPGKALRLDSVGV